MNFIKYLWAFFGRLYRGECLQHVTPEDQYRARTSAIPCSACTAAFMVKLEKEDRERLQRNDPD